jgi:hypothetical protein
MGEDRQTGHLLTHPLTALVLRIVLGCVFIYASLDKIRHPDLFAEAVYNYQLLPEVAINLWAIWLPWSGFPWSAGNQPSSRPGYPLWLFYDSERPYHDRAGPLSRRSLLTPCLFSLLAVSNQKCPGKVFTFADIPTPLISVTVF